MKTHSVIGGGGLALHVAETGNPDGKPILFVHGISQCHLAWNKQLHSELERDFRLVAFDLRGHGLSDKPRDVYGAPELWAEDIHAVMTTLGLHKPVLVGWSYGGVAISDYLGAFGDQAVAGTQWVAAVCRLGEPLVREGFMGDDFLALVPGLFSDSAADSATTLERFLRLCVHDAQPAEDAYCFLGYNSVVPAHVRESLLARTVNNDAVMRGLRTPVSLVHGEADQIVSPRMSAHIHSLVPDATVSAYPAVGHMPFWEAPERFNRELREFRTRL